jgi:hypothetical protein
MSNPTITRQQVIALLAQFEDGVLNGEEVLAYSDLSNLDLSDLDFKGVSFRYCNLNGTHFTHSILDNCSFDYASMRNTFVLYASMRNADLTNLNTRISDIMGIDFADITEMAFDQPLSSVQVIRSINGGKSLWSTGGDWVDTDVMVDSMMGRMGRQHNELVPMLLGICGQMLTLGTTGFLLTNGVPLTDDEYALIVGAINSLMEHKTKEQPNE